MLKHGLFWLYLLEAIAQNFTSYPEILIYGNSIMNITELYLIFSG